MNVPACEIHATRHGHNVIIAFSDWFKGAQFDGDGHVASVTVPVELLNGFDDVTSLSHVRIANVRYEITNDERVDGGWKLRLYAIGAENDAE